MKSASPGAMVLLRITCTLIAILFCFPSAAMRAQSQDNEVTPEVQQLYAQAQAAQQRQDIPAAIEKYRQMIRLAPHLAAAYNNLGRLYFNQHDYGHAAQTLAQGLKLNPDMPTASAMLGMSYLQAGQVQKAEEPLETALRANPKDAVVQISLAKVLIRLYKYDEAVKLLKTYTEENPKDQEAWYLLGKTYLQLSENSLGKIHQIDPNSVVAHEVAGEIDESMHNYDGALVEYKKAIDLAPDQSEPHIHMANTFWSISKWDSARTEFEAGLARDPNNRSLEAGEHDSGGERRTRRGAGAFEQGSGTLSRVDAGPRRTRASSDQVRKARSGVAGFVGCGEGKSRRTFHPFPSRLCIQGTRKDRDGPGGDAYLWPAEAPGE
jgi:tetratricopeptide (TPR) repeat protein